MSKKPTVREFMKDGLLKLLGDNGLAIQSGLKSSAPQRDYSQRWVEAICRGVDNRAADPESPGSVMLAAADTGTGKTIGYGVPLLLRAAMGVKVGISTHSHALQRQFFGTKNAPGDLVRIADWIEQIGFGKMKIARRLGRQAFVSRSAVEALISKFRDERESLKLTVRDLADLDPILEFAIEANDGKNSGLIEELRDMYFGELPLNITAASISLGIDSDEDDFRAYDGHVEAAEAADVVIFSHAYIAACALYKGGNLLNNKIDCLVIDEADRLLDVAATAFNFETSLRRSTAGLKSAGSSGSTAYAAMNELSDFAQSLCGNNQAAIAMHEMPANSRNRLIELTNTAKEAVTTLIASASHSKMQRTQKWSDILELESVLQQFLSATNGSDANGNEIKENFYVAAIGFSPVRGLPSIAVMPRNPGRLLAKLWSANTNKTTGSISSPLNSVLLTSATLGVPGRYNNVMDRFRSVAIDLGIDLTGKRKDQRAEIDLWSNFEPDKFGAVRFIITDPSIPSPVRGSNDDASAILDEEWIEYATMMIRKAKAAGGRTLVLCTSYRDVETFSTQLLHAGLDTLQQLRGQSSKDLEARFLEKDDSIWLSPTAWEGLNLPNAIKNLVIPRIPFSAPSNMEGALLRSYGKYSNEAISAILYAKMMNGTKRKLRQGLGRPIRTATDQARYWIADPRFPRHPNSSIALRHPESLMYSTAKQFSGLHAVVPYRFDGALENAEILLKNGEIIR